MTDETSEQIADNREITIEIHRVANLAAAKEMISNGATPEFVAVWLTRQANEFWPTYESALGDLSDKL